MISADTLDQCQLYKYNQEFYLINREILDLDKSDQETLKTFIKDSESFTVLAKAQLLEVFIKD